MTNWIKLDELILSSKTNYTELSKACGFSHSWLHNKRRRNADFTATEITAICSVLGIDKEGRESIFFADNVDCKSTDEPA